MPSSSSRPATAAPPGSRPPSRSRRRDIEGLAAWCRERQPDLVVVGPDDPLAAGIVDALGAADMRAFGPTAAAARIEASKAWASEVCAAAGVPIPESHVFDDADDADAFVRGRGAVFVVKADGLALGKGVIVPDTWPRTARRDRPRGAARRPSAPPATGSCCRSG